MQVDVAVVEVGIGGRTDYTNVVSPCAAGISRLDYDHTAVLGSTLREIALHKAGILKVRIGSCTRAAISEEGVHIYCKWHLGGVARAYAIAHRSAEGQDRLYCEAGA